MVSFKPNVRWRRWFSAGVSLLLQPRCTAAAGSAAVHTQPSMPACPHSRASTVAPVHAYFVRNGKLETRASCLLSHLLEVRRSVLNLIFGNLISAFQHLLLSPCSMRMRLTSARVSAARPGMPRARSIVPRPRVSRPRVSRARLRVCFSLSCF